jgi:pantetheine-phosphate adenylyltransferase
MEKAIYPGSFDPVTNGHLDVIQRAGRLCDSIVVAVAFNEEKTSLFEVEERIALIEEATHDQPKVVSVTSFDGLLVDFARSEGAVAIVRGLRAISDFEFEFQMALMNRKLAPELETIFLMPTEEYTYLSSRIVREIARLHGDVSAFVPSAAAEALAKKFSS